MSTQGDAAKHVQCAGGCGNMVQVPAWFDGEAYCAGCKGKR